MRAPTRLPALVTAFVLWAACQATARAQLHDCPKIAENPTPYKVVIDDLVIAGPAPNSDLVSLRDNLRFRLQNELLFLPQQVGISTELMVVDCLDRKPSDSSEFTHDRASLLNSQRVLLEFWGLIEERRPANAAARREAQLHYVIMALQDYDYGDARVPATPSVRYPRAPAGTTASADKLLENLPELPIYALIGLGTKARHAANYPGAVTALRKAESLLADLRAMGDRQDLQSLFTYVHGEVCSTIGAAKSDPVRAGVLASASVEDCL